MTGPGVNIPPALRSAIIWTLLNEGFPRPDAETWADGWTCRADPTVVLAQAIAFDDHGIPLNQAIAWHQHGFYAAEATCFYDARYHPTDAATICNLVEDDADTDEWVATGLPAHRVIAYLKAGVTPAEAPAFETSPDVTPQTLTFLTALLCT